MCVLIYYNFFRVHVNDDNGIRLFQTINGRISCLEQWSCEKVLRLIYKVDAQSNFDFFDVKADKFPPDSQSVIHGCVCNETLRERKSRLK